MLDVDIIRPEQGKAAVENITWSDRNKMPSGKYELFVHCYSNRGGHDGFKAEVEFDGQIHSFEYSWSTFTTTLSDSWNTFTTTLSDNWSNFTANIDESWAEFTKSVYSHWDAFDSRLIQSLEIYDAFLSEGGSWLSYTESITSSLANYDSFLQSSGTWREYSDSVSQNLDNYTTFISEGGPWLDYTSYVKSGLGGYSSFISDDGAWKQFNNSLLNAVTEFSDYFLKHKVYDEAYSYESVREIQQKEKSEAGDAVYALAEALTQNTTDLKDPAVQTNAILSQILLVVQAIMQQNNDVAGTVSLSETLQALSLGITTTTM